MGVSVHTVWKRRGKLTNEENAQCKLFLYS